MTPMRPPSFQEAFVDESGNLTIWARQFLTAVFNRLGGPLDKVDEAFVLASGAVPQTTEIVAAFGLAGGGALTANVGVQLGMGAFTVAALPTGALGQWAYAVDGRKHGESSGSGSGTWTWFDGSNWICMDSGATVAA